MKQEKINKLVVKLKLNACKLNESGCLPLFLFKDICKLGCDTSNEVLEQYKFLTQKYLRVKGFYVHFKDEYKRLYDEYLRDKEERRLS